MTSDTDESGPEVPIVCPECETTSRVPLATVADAVARHNDTLHGGREVATVDPDVKAYLADMVAEDLGLVDDPD